MEDPQGQLKLGINVKVFRCNFKILVQWHEDIPSQRQHRWFLTLQMIVILNRDRKVCSTVDAQYLKGSVAVSIRPSHAQIVCKQLIVQDLLINELSCHSEQEQRSSEKKKLGEEKYFKLIPSIDSFNFQVSFK